MKSLNSSQISAASRLFSSAVVRELARNGSSPLFANLAKEILLTKKIDGEYKVSQFFELVFNKLKTSEHRNEYIYKSALAQKILLGRHTLKTASMLNEFRILDCKADVAILNGTATVYEIKSERDSLARLEHQVNTYRKFFATVNVIAGENHIKGVQSVVPKDVGILKLSNRFQISNVRSAKIMPERTSPEVIFDSIRVEEAKKILLQNGFAIPDLPNTEIYEALRKLFLKLNSEDAHSGMVKVLKHSRNLHPFTDLVNELPMPLYSAVLSARLRKTDHKRLLNAVSTSMPDALRWA